MYEIVARSRTSNSVSGMTWFFLFLFLSVGMVTGAVLVLKNAEFDIRPAPQPIEVPLQRRVFDYSKRPAYTRPLLPSNMEDSSGFHLPVKGSISSPFGMRRHPITKRRDFHAGIDIAASRGTPIRSAQSGIVRYSGWMGGYGRIVIIDHDDDYSTLYAHCNSFLVKAGQTVERGEKIALVGNSGTTTGYHLHFEVHRGGYVIDPSFVFKR